MKKGTWCFAVVLLTFAIPSVAMGQAEQEEEPTVLRLSFYKCDFSDGAGDRIEEEIENQVMPVWEEIVAENEAIQDYGYFYHWWADEYNVGIYTIGESIGAIVDAESEAGDRLEERFGDQDSAFLTACPAHKDGFYTFGPTVVGPVSDQDGGQ